MSGSAMGVRVTAGLCVVLAMLQLIFAQSDVDSSTMGPMVAAATGVMAAMNESEMAAMIAADLMSEREMPAVPARERFRVELPELPKLVDCFGLPSWLATPLRRLFSINSPAGVNTRFYLKTRKSRTRQEIKLGDQFSLEGTGFDPAHRTIMIVHGFFSTGEEEWVHEMMDALLGKMEANVFAVDWSGHRSSWRYWRAVANTRVTGYDMTRFVEDLVNAGMSTDNLHLIGHSLGAHICGFVSRNLKGVARITGLDPAQPCFRSSDPRMTLDHTDASFVDILHTNGRTLRDIGLGLPYDIGHVDFYPNGGMTQPGCETPPATFLGRLTGNIYGRINQAYCSHGRAYMLYTESIRKGRDCIFWGHRWNRSDSTMDSSMNAPCSGSGCTPLGLYTDLFPGRGSFIMHTVDHPAYCIPEEDSNKEIKMAARRDNENSIPGNA